MRSSTYYITFLTGSYDGLLSQFIDCEGVPVIVSLAVHVEDGEAEEDGISRWCCQRPCTAYVIHTLTGRVYVTDQYIQVTIDLYILAFVLTFSVNLLIIWRICQHVTSLKWFILAIIS